MMGFDSYISYTNPGDSGVWRVSDYQFEIGLDEFKCNSDTKYVADNYEESMSTCSYKTPDSNDDHDEDIVIKCLVSGIYN